MIRLLHRCIDAELEELGDKMAILRIEQLRGSPLYTP